MRSTILLLFSLACQALAVPHEQRSRKANQASSQNFYPQAVVSENASPDETSPFSSFSLSSKNPVATLDYGHEVAGYPFFQVSAFTGKVQIEVKYAEVFSYLSLNHSDGPFPFAVGLTNTYRVETLQVSSKGQLNSFFAQGGQRWQSIRLLTSGTVTFSNVGFVSTITTTDVDSLPGHFNSSNTEYNNIWKLGARAVSAACFSAGAYKATWEVSSAGALVRGSRAGLTTEANSFEDYTLNFQTKIQRGGAGWAVAFPVGGTAGGIQLNLVGDYPSATTFANVDSALLPPNSVALAYGFDFINQTTLSSYYLDNFSVPFNVKEGTWYSVTASLSAGNYLAVSINGHKVFNVTLNDYYTATTGDITTGAFGFGGYQDQVAYFANVSVVASNGTTIYTNALTDSSTVLPEYGVNTNLDSVCLDGAKRDRLVWLGDFFHTVPIIETSTSRSDYASSTLQVFLDWQLPTGQLPLKVSIGYPGSASTVFAIDIPTGLFYPLADYHILGLIAFGSYMRYSNDVSFANETWSSWKLAVNWLTSQINSTTGLVDLDTYGVFIGPGNGLAVNAESVQALNMLSAVATAVGDTDSAASWNSTATSLSSKIQSAFWNADLGVFADSQTDATAYSTAGISFVITSGVATTQQALSCLNVLENLKLSPGYKDSTSVSSSGTVDISPNINGFLLSALLQSNLTSQAKYLFDNLWTAMLSNTSTNTGASWEYVNTELQPGLGAYTSLSHPWGGAPTYILTEYVAGIKPVSFGYKTWVIEPAFSGFDLTSASAKVQTPYGVLSASWSIKGKKLSVFVTSPAGTSGSFVLNRAFQNSTLANTVVSIKGGSTKSLVLKI